MPKLDNRAGRLRMWCVGSGDASLALLSSSGGGGAFLRGRTYRLLVPLIFGMAVIVPPQPWVELTVKHSYDAGFLTFWARDYFRFEKLACLDLPTWNHLWFVAYLWIYTLLIGALAFLPWGWAQRGFDRVFGGWGVLAVPIAWAVAIHAWWFPMVGETHALFGDWIAHVTYVPAFLFGFGLARSEPAMAAIARLWPVAAAIAVAGYAGVIGVELSWPGNVPAPRWVHRPYGLAHALQQWGAIIALIGVAERFWNRDRPVRATLTEAVFPFYIIHQTVIVVVLYWLLPLALPGWGEFLILVAATVAGCLAFYFGGRAIPPLRPLVGLRRRTAPRRLAEPAIA